jgi:hypothetical protein
MNSLMLPNLPDHLLTQLRARAEKTGRTVEEEAVSALGQGLGVERPGDADTGPCAFERPLSGPTVLVPVGGERLPALPVILEPTAE